MTEPDPDIIIPTMSTETERTFSDTKHVIPPTRTGLGVDIVEAEECLRARYKAGIWEGEEGEEGGEGGGEVLHSHWSKEHRSNVKYVNYAFRFSGPVTALRAGTRAKSKSSHGSVTPNQTGTQTSHLHPC